MPIRAVYFDFGGVLVRTEDRDPRTRLAESLGLTYAGIEEIVFGKASIQPTLGEITEEQHWLNVVHRLDLPQSEVERVRTEFFKGDFPDRELLGFIRELRETLKVGLISNAWSGLRSWIISQGFDELFDAMTISAEVGFAKPDPRIYRFALEQLGVMAAEAVFLDDFLANVEGARAVGMTAIHFLQPVNALDELRELLTNRV